MEYSVTSTLSNSLRRSLFSQQVPPSIAITSERPTALGGPDRSAIRKVGVVGVCHSVNSSWLNIPLVVKSVLKDYALPLIGDHGVAHWARVLENGMRLAEETGANVEVVQLFAVLHDSRRQNEVTDPEHGPRAAELAMELRGIVFNLDDEGIRLLYKACHGHTHQRTHPDVTVQTCWDSDRLDLGRVGITPHPSRLCTRVAKRPDMIKWADGRASFGVVPTFVLDDWGIDLENQPRW